MERLAHIPFNKAYFVGTELEHIKGAIDAGKLSGNGTYTKKSQELLRTAIGGSAVLLTSSCTDALEMAAILCDIEPGDEIIMPSYTFVSTANAFILRGAKVRFVDSRTDHPGMDESQIEGLINERTKVICPVHYAGVACDMDKIMEVSKRHGLKVVEDAAQCVSSNYKGKPLGSIGHFGAFSFHETKNISSGEGGALSVNNAEDANRAEIIWEKGTNRSAFWRGEVDKYGWVDIGSSFLPSEVTAAVLYAQLKEIDHIQQSRLEIWNRYHEAFQILENRGLGLPVIPAYATNNAHMFYLVCESEVQRSRLIDHLKRANINAVFHYQSLHQSKFFESRHDGRSLPNCERYSGSLIRLPLFAGLQESDQQRVINEVLKFFSNT